MRPVLDVNGRVGRSDNDRIEVAAEHGDDRFGRALEHHDLEIARVAANGLHEQRERDMRVLPNAFANPIDSACGLLRSRSAKSRPVLIGDSVRTAMSA